MSLRGRIIRSSLLTLAVGLGALLVCGNVLLAVRTKAETATLLQARVDAALATLTVTPTSITVRDVPNDSVLDRQAWILQGDRVLERPMGARRDVDAEAIALGRAGDRRDVEPLDDVRLRVVPVAARGADEPTGAVVVALPVGSVERLRKEVLLGSVVFAAFVLLAGALAMRGAVDGALRPVARMTEDAESWGAHDLDGRFALGPPRDELTGLAATLDGLLARIAASRRHEQRFASEVAHELRTPLAGIRGRAELALTASGPEAPGEHEAALRAVVAGAARLDATVDTLLAIARRELDPTEGTVDVAALAREVPDVEVSVEDALPAAEGDPDVVRRALAPLVANARRYAARTVRLELSADGGRVRITVRDDGPGLDPELGERAFAAGVRGADAPGDGAGLGLPLARRLAQSCGGDVVLGTGPGGCFVLELPAVGAGPA